MVQTLHLLHSHFLFRLHNHITSGVLRAIPGELSHRNKCPDSLCFQLLSTDESCARIHLPDSLSEDKRDSQFLIKSCKRYHDEMKSTLNSGNACYHSVQNLLSSRFISKNLKIEIYKTVILPVVLYGCETWSLTLREEHRLRVLENRLLRIFGPKWTKRDRGENCIMMNFKTCILHPVLLR
jgi:hypothetical protein